MAQEISQGSIWGRLGSALGRGIEETVPKELDRYRMNQGLQQLEKDSPNLNNQQYYTRALQVPGLIDKPQAIQSLVENQKYQNRINAYGKLGNQLPASADLSSVRQAQIDDTLAKAGILPRQQQGQQPQQGQGQPQQGKQPYSDQSTRGAENQIVETPAVNELAKPVIPWTPEKIDQRAFHYIESGFTPEEGYAKAERDAKLYEENPKAYEAQEKFYDTKSKNLKDELTRQLELKTQKKGDDIFADIPGEYILQAQKGMERDAKANPKATTQDIADTWAERLFGAVKANKRLETKLATTGKEAFRNENFHKDLMEYSKIFKDAGLSEKFYEDLAKFGFSPQARAAIAFPPTKEVEKYINTNRLAQKSFKEQAGYFGKGDQFARKAAIDVGNLIKDDDSIQSIMRELHRKNPWFDSRAFLDQLSEDKDRLRLNNRQKNEIAEGVGDILPSWADFLLSWR